MAEECYNLPNGLALACNRIMEIPNAPKRKKEITTTVNPIVGTTPTTNPISEDSVLSKIVSLSNLPQLSEEQGRNSNSLSINFSPIHQSDAETFIFNTFPWIPISFLRSVLSKNQHYIIYSFVEIRKCEKEEMELIRKSKNATSIDRSSCSYFQSNIKYFKFLKCKRSGRLYSYGNKDPCNSLKNEISLLEKLLKNESEERDHEFAQKLNEEEYEKQGALITCPCCYEE